MTTRRTILKSMAASAGAALGATVAPWRRARAMTGNGMNVVMLILDDMNDWVGYLGRHPQAKTPNIDGLADQAVSFGKAFCTVPLCNASRVSTLSGLAPSTTDIWFNRDDGRHVPHLVTHFQQHGYRAVRAGKVFHHGLEYEGWDQVFAPSAAHPAPVNTRPAVGADITFDWGGVVDAGPAAVNDESMYDYRLAQDVAGFLAQPQAEPFLLCYGTNLPHLPWFVPQSHFDLFPLDDVEVPLTIAGDLDDVPPQVSGDPTFTFVHQQVTAADAWKPLIQGYLAASHFADTCVGVVLDALNSSPYKDNTIVMLCSDHGFHLGEKGRWGKWTLYNESLRVPLIVRTPNTNSAGERCDRVVSLLDLYPTLCELTEIDTPSGLEGNAVVELLNNPGAPWDEPAFSALTVNRESVRTERWRYSRYRYSSTTQWSEELYDCSSDPYQHRNLASNSFFDSVRSQLAGLLDNRRSGSAAFPCGQPSIDFAGDDAAFLWRECDSGLFHFHVAGASGTPKTHSGSIISSLPVANVQPNSVETPWDTLTVQGSRIDFQFKTLAWQDGFTFDVPAGASLQVELASNTILRVGEARFEVATPFETIA